MKLEIGKKYITDEKDTIATVIGYDKDVWGGNYPYIVELIDGSGKHELECFKANGKCANYTDIVGLLPDMPEVEVGKTYRTKDGGTARIVARSDFCVYSYVGIDEMNDIITYTIHGKYMSDKVSPRDIVIKSGIPSRWYNLIQFWKRIIK